MSIFNRPKRLTVDEILAGIDALGQEEVKKLFRAMFASDEEAAEAAKEAAGAEETGEGGENTPPEGEAPAEGAETVQDGTEAPAEGEATAAEETPAEPAAEPTEQAPAAEAEQAPTEEPAPAQDDETARAMEARIAALEDLVGKYAQKLEAITAKLDDCNFGNVRGGQETGESADDDDDRIMRAYYGAGYRR